MNIMTFPFSFTGILLSHSTPDTSVQFFHHTCILLVTSLSSLPATVIVDPRYLNPSTLLITSPSSLTSTRCSLSRSHTPERHPPMCAYFASPASSCKQCDVRVCHACAVHHTSLRIEL